jgi:hypothetical protein
MLIMALLEISGHCRESIEPWSVTGIKCYVAEAARAYYVGSFPQNQNAIFVTAAKTVPPLWRDEGDRCVVK